MNILIFGDSIAWGAYDPEQGGWANRLRNYFEANNEDINIYNLGIPGDTTTNLLSRINAEAQSRQPDIIIFAIGINDSQFISSQNETRTQLNLFGKNLEKLLSVANQYTKQVIFIGLTPVDESKTSPIPWDTDLSYSNDSIQQFNGIIEKFCEDKKVRYIAMNNVISNKDLIDGLHPNTAGHIKIFERIKPEIEVLL